MPEMPNALMRDGSPAFTAPVAARILGVSESTVHRRVASGRLAGEQFDRGSKRFTVVPADVVHRASSPSSAPSDDAGRDASELFFMLDTAQLRADLRAAESRIAELEARLLLETERRADAERERNRLASALRSLVSEVG